jgi:hypothetical protein
VGDAELPDGLVDLLEETDVELPEPGTENWKFQITRNDLPERIESTDTTSRFGVFSRQLKRYGCRLNQEYRVDDNTRHFDYRVPNSGWPEPLGYHVGGLRAKTDENPEFQTPKTRITTRENRFYAPINGGIPKKGDDRHESIPDRAYGLRKVVVSGPERFSKNKPVIADRVKDVDFPEDKWAAYIEYARSVTTTKQRVEYYSTEIGDFPRVQIWEYSPHSPFLRKRVELFDTRQQAVEFIEKQTGAPVSENWPELNGGENQ